MVLLCSLMLIAVYLGFVGHSTFSGYSCCRAFSWVLSIDGKVALCDGLENLDLPGSLNTLLFSCFSLDG